MKQKSYGMNAEQVSDALRAFAKAAGLAVLAFREFSDASEVHRFADREACAREYAHRFVRASRDLMCPHGVGDIGRLRAVLKSMRVKEL